MKILIVLICLLLIQPVLAQEKSLTEIDSMMTAGWYEEANVLLDAHLEEESPDPQALFLKAMANLHLGHLDEAQEWSEMTVEADPHHALGWSLLGTTKAFQIQRSRLKALTLGRSCKKNYERGMKEDPTQVISVQSLMQFHLRAPGIAGGNKNTARQLAEDIYAIDPARGHMARALIYRIADQDMVAARREMAAAAELNLDDHGMWYEVARNLVLEGHFEDAVDYYQLGIERDPNPTFGMVLLAGAYLEQGFLDDAQATYEAVLSLEPENPSGVIGTGLVLLARGQTPEAVEVFRDLRARQPNYPPARYYLATALNTLDTNPEEAAFLLQEYLDRYLNIYWPSRSLANWQLALALESLGKYNEAWEVLSWALEHAPGNDEMKIDALRLEFMAKD